MNQAATMPEPKYRSTKKREQSQQTPRTPEAVAEAQTLPPAGQAAKDKKAAGKKAGFNPVLVWPVAVGFFLSGYAEEWHRMAMQVGMWLVRFTFPLSLLGAHREIGIDAYAASSLPHIGILAQLPFDGLLLMLSFVRTKSLKSAIFQVTLVHALCAFVLWLTTFAGK